ncbi:MAG TPA: hypothetical protein VMV94_17000 [Phycisphaerae bacterium]|nr:hypothetical protein [Phycisphaerae bacterium]
MRRLPKTRPRPVIAPRFVLCAIAAAVYFGLPAAMGPPSESIGHFTRLASAFVHGRLDLRPDRNPNFFPSELIPSSDGKRLYCAYPPLPAILLVPFVAVFGLAVRVQDACRLVSVINVFVFDACLTGLPKLLGEQDLRISARLALDLLFAFGTVAWHNCMLGGDWHLAHAVALCAMLLALREFVGINRPWAIGCFTALAVMARPTTGLTCLFFVLPLIRTRSLRKLLAFAIGPCVAVILLGLYNYARFGNLFDFGYTRMLLRGAGREMMQQYGQFNSHFILPNLFWFFLAPPWPMPQGKFPWLGFDPMGLSLFISCPAMLYVFVAIVKRWRLPTVQNACIATAACLIPLLLYFNTGYWQFGHRFSMDYLPLLMILTLAGMGIKPGRLAYSLIVLAIGIQIWGNLLRPVAELPL